MLQSSHHNNMTRDVFITLSRVRIDGGVRVVVVSYNYSWGLLVVVRRRLIEVT